MKLFSKYFCLIFFIIVMSCDDKDASLSELNVSPNLEYFTNDSNGWNNINGSIIQGHAKVWTPANNLNYSVAFRARDFNNNFGTLSINSLSEELIFFINDTPYVNTATVNLNSLSLAVRNNQPTIKTFNVTVEDTWGAQESAYFEIKFHENLSPISGLSLELVEEIADNEYLLDASSSFDQDNYLGGFIVEYEYIIDDVVITIPINQIYHVFSQGQHTIKLRCKDNDDVWSDQITTTLTIP